jgi:hypothetical protein
LFVDNAAALVVACQPAELTASSPTNGQENVPVDAEIGLIFSDSCASDPSELALTVEIIMGDEVVESAQVTASFPMQSSFVAVKPSQSLLPDTEYSVRVQESENSRIWDLSFTTGTDTVQHPAGELTASMHSSIWDKHPDGRAVYYQLDVQAVPDPQDLSTLHLVFDDDPSTFIGSARTDAEGGLEGLHANAVTGKKEAPCVRVVQRDGSGNMDLSTDAICPSYTRIGCQSLGAVPSALAFMWLPGLAFIRRRGGSAT